MRYLLNILIFFSRLNATCSLCFDGGGGGGGGEMSTALLAGVDGGGCGEVYCCGGCGGVG